MVYQQCFAAWPHIETGTVRPGLLASLMTEMVSQSQVWQVSALCSAVAKALDARLNPVLVRGEITGFTRATSGHCYFLLKDQTAQIRCAIFRRAAALLDFSPCNGELVDVRGTLGVYEARGDLQLMVQGMNRTGVGALFEQFQQLKAKLEALGLFAAARKRPLPLMPRAIGLVTSPAAAALHDVVNTLQRRLPHIGVVLAPASVQGAAAPAELIAALGNLARPLPGAAGNGPSIDVILLVRGGGSMEDLWAFNDERLAHAIASSPVPVVCGVGHETDFTIADFVADLRAPTPTAAAELVAQPRSLWLELLERSTQRLHEALQRQLERQQQRLDMATSRLTRPGQVVAAQRLQLDSSARRLSTCLGYSLQQHRQQLAALPNTWLQAHQRALQHYHERLTRAALQLGLLDPALVLQRGYAWLSSADGQAIGSVRQTHAGQRLRATLADGTVDLTVRRGT